jgi:hypothetical protein
MPLQLGRKHHRPQRPAPRDCPQLSELEQIDFVEMKTALSFGILLNEALNPNVLHTMTVRVPNPAV